MDKQEGKAAREFETGATRDSAEGKFVPRKFGSALVDNLFCRYMHENRIQSDGKLRDGDNWKKGIPIEAYYDSLDRHVKDVLACAEGFRTEKHQLENLLALKFNVDGLIYELAKLEGLDSETIKWYER